MESHGIDLKIRGLVKSFGGNRVLQPLDLDISPGEFVGLVGPNGAGKSTLLKILAGVYERDGGEILLAGEPVKELGSRAAVGFVHQDTGLIDALSISDNLRLGEPPMRWRGTLLNHVREREAAREALRLVDLDRDVATPVSDLSPAEKTLVAIARALQRGARILFVDEATSTLPPRDAKRLLETLRGAAAGGAAIVMVTHKLSEILDATDRVVLLLDGHLAADVTAEGLDREALVRMLLSHEAQARAVAAEVSPGRELLRLDAVHAPGVGPLDLTVHAHEVIGLTGLPGSGLHDVAYLLSGRTSPHAGEFVRAKDVTVGLVPPHRESQGGFARLSVASNMTISSLKTLRSAVGLLRKRQERQLVEETSGSLSVQPADPEAEYSTLSGGNKQKVIFGRVMLQQPDVYVLCEPTRGVDIATRAEIYRLIGELRTHDVGVVVISSDSEDLFAVCDRIGVVTAGQIAHFDRMDAFREKEMEVFV